MTMVMPLAIVVIDNTCHNTNGIVSYNAMSAGEQSKQKNADKFLLFAFAVL